MNTVALPSKKRIDSIDRLRGIIMVIMALDHVRDFFHIDAMTGDPTNPETTTPILFLTRWITHFCAPLFVFLAGTSVFLTGQKRSKKDLSIFLLKRGIWLVALEIVVFNFLFSFDPSYSFIGLQVIWVTGLSMMLMAALVYLPVPVLFALGLLLVAGHNFLDRFNDAPNATDRSMIWALLHQQYFAPGGGRLLGVLYPLIPWPGIMLLGYCLGSWFSKDYDPAMRRKQLVQTGLLTVTAFFILRWLNVYGDLFPWSEQKNTTATIISFFNVTKYPPSLLYCCMTIGPGLLLLAWLEKTRARWADIVVIYGRVPLFYYMLHFLVIHLLCMIAFFATGHTMAQATGGLMVFRPNDFGFSLGVVYLIWIAVVAGLYPVCKKYSEYKAAHTQWWLSYF
ncbi:DUF1624 domain-containing protein [Sediminibacterium soli]|uniref:DUF1624 domain-containing protein n=1 Tax=Sediminibacterium soli TaxID=2698829 RepID=UPI00137A23E2|nr:heparan-alpha-glucosaminide N-acetyltransferase domain-containing protein [Sediminibacterium soli]NCI45657.1 DUF1624 domain-containing protein [Sediminibacterium soli]